jgi:hypothetical protein
MIVRILIAAFASFVSGFSYLVGLHRLMTALLVGFGGLSSLFFGVLFLLPADKARLIFPISENVPSWPYFILGLVLLGMVGGLFLVKAQPADFEEVSSKHFKYMLGGIVGYLTSLFFSSLFWFPSDETRRSVAESTLSTEVLIGTVIFILGVCGSCYLLYRASKGSSESNPDLMRRFVLALFAFFQFDKMPLLVAYLLLNTQETGVVFPNIAALAFAAYIPVSLFLIKTTWDAKTIEM